MVSMGHGAKSLAQSVQKSDDSEFGLRSPAHRGLPPTPRLPARRASLQLGERECGMKGQREEGRGYAYNDRRRAIAQRAGFTLEPVTIVFFL